MEVLDLLDPAPAAERYVDRLVEHRATPQHFGSDFADRLRHRFGGQHRLRELLDQRAIGENLEGRARLPPPGRNHVVLQLLEVDVSNLGQHVAGEIDGEGAGTQLVVVRVVRMSGQVGLQGEIDRFG